MAAVGRMKLGSQGLEVSVQGLGCMGMSMFYGPPKPDEEMIPVIREAVSLGVTFLDTADAYGAGANEILVGKAIQGIRDKVQIGSKFGGCIAKDGSVSLRGDPAHVRAACEASLQRLGVDCIDLYYLIRLDPKVPIEITVGELKKLVGEGKVKYIGLSEAPASEIRRAHAVHPITAVQLEWSLWARDVEEEIVPVCRELGIGIVAYSPLGRGFFARKDLLDDLSEDDHRKTLPRLLPHHQERNKLMFEHLQAFAIKKNSTPGQIALAWIHSQGTDVATIPGTTKVKNLKDNINSLAVHLSKEDLQEIEAIIPKDVLSEERYDGPTNALCWKYASTPALSSWQGE